MLGIAIINYNTFEKTVDCINSVFETAQTEYKIYLLDNASQNNSFEELSKRFSQDERVKLIKSKENLGYARGNNLLIESAKADGCNYVIIANNDIVFKENAIDTLVSEIKESGAFIVSPKILSPDGRQQISVKKIKPTFKEHILFSNYIIGHFVSKKKTKEYFKKTAAKDRAEIYWMSGSCFIADIKQFEKVGYFDPNTFLFFEEYIIAEKAMQNGLKIIFNPEAEVIHYHGASMGKKANLFTRTESFKSEVYMFSNYWIIPKSKLKLLRFTRCLEVIYTFTKEKQFKDALTFIKESRKIIKTAPRKEK